MIRSMTAFARSETSVAAGDTLIWEIRSVNHRYLEPGFKIPDTFRAIEATLRDVLRKKLNRGKLECSLRYQASAAGANSLDIDHGLLDQLISKHQQIQSKLGSLAAPTTLDLLRWPGVLKEPEQDKQALLDAALQAFEATVSELTQTREREGAELANLIEQRLSAINTIVAEVRTLLPGILQQQRDRLHERLAELQGELDQDRLEQEMVLLANRSDVAEELDRLDTHVAEVGRILKKGGPCGRRLDFMMQELNREANTLSSKSIVSTTTQSAVELKVLIEQMREQIQNIE